MTGAETPRATVRPQDVSGRCLDGLQGLWSVLLVRDGWWTRYELDFFAAHWHWYTPLYRAADGHLRAYGGPLAREDVEAIYGPVEQRGKSLYPVTGGNSAANQPRLQPNIVVSAAGAGSVDGLTPEELEWLRAHVERQRPLGGATVAAADKAMRRALGGGSSRMVGGRRIRTERLVGRVLEQLDARPRRRPLLLTPADKTRAFR